ncbi:MAG: phosphatase PAP2 family protein [Ignavibacteria bacterium]|nr:phosphatase PAP2 family protein [Ignavibacteria bacterium]
MFDLLLSFDREIFYFFNSTFTFLPFDSLMPFLTDYHKNTYIICGILLLLIYLFWKGEKNIRVAILLVIPTLIISDQLSSTVLKHFFERQRPCIALENVRLLVTCGSGFSFPSSHAVNNFAVATLFGAFFKQHRWKYFAFTSIIAYSRVYVGVHYPSDIFAGAIIGVCCGLGVYKSWKFFSIKFQHTESLPL